MKGCVRAGEESASLLCLSAPVCAHMHMPPVVTVIWADDVFKVARQLGDGALGEC